MNKIHLLDPKVIDKIAAGEVVNRPVNVVKELIENACDAQATALTVEIRNGGMDLIRVTDDGCGIEASEIKAAFLSHATSKLTKEEELLDIPTFGFRGEALSSIAAVSKVELITKTEASLSGSRFVIEGSEPKTLEEAGAPQGTTIIVRDLFYNTPARRKFLKSPGTEAGYIAQMLENLALAKPQISMKFINNGQTKLQTTGSGDLREVIYRIYGRQTAKQLMEFHSENDSVRIEGYLGSPAYSRSNRNLEIYFANDRIVKDKVISKAIEDGYLGRLMQHRFPFCVLSFDFAAGEIDVNVHPAKMEIRLHHSEEFYRFVSGAIEEALSKGERIREEEPGRAVNPAPAAMPDQPVKSAVALMQDQTVKSAAAVMPDLAVTPAVSEAPLTAPEPFEFNRRRDFVSYVEKEQESLQEDLMLAEEEKLPVFLKKEQPEKPFEQLSLDIPKQLSYRIIGQVFETYWLIEAEGKLYYMDQHAAHEKVNYERFCKKLLNGSIVTQNLLPPIILELDGREESVYLKYAEDLAALGFEIEPFGGRSYCMRGVPADLWGYGEKELFLTILDELSEEVSRPAGETVIRTKIASMACKASVKGNMSMTEEEVRALFAEMMELEDPFHCPHGRPTLILVTKSELEKKFGRIQQ